METNDIPKSHSVVMILPVQPFVSSCNACQSHRSMRRNGPGVGSTYDYSVDTPTHGDWRKHTFMTRQKWCARGLPDEQEHGLEDQSEDHELHLLVGLAARDRGLAVARERVVVCVAEDELACEDDVDHERHCVFRDVSPSKMDSERQRGNAPIWNETPASMMRPPYELTM